MKTSLCSSLLTENGRFHSLFAHRRTGNFCWRGWGLFTGPHGASLNITLCEVSSLCKDCYYYHYYYFPQKLSQAAPNFYETVEKKN